MAWNPWNSGETWISYSFDTMYNFSKVRIYAEAWTNPLDLDYYIEGSNDGTTWTNIAIKGGHVDVNFVPRTGVNNFQQIETVILLDGTKRYSKIRLRIDGPNVNYGNDRLFMVYDFSIYASDTVSTPLIYYKNILYNPNIKELPNTVVADAGKILEVNSIGEWDTGDIPESYVALTQAQYDALPSSKLTDGKMYYITDQDEPSDYVALTQAQYDALPSSKLTDGKMYCITDQDVTELPAVSSSDNGKVLKVVNGAWDKGDIPTPDPSLPALIYEADAACGTGLDLGKISSVSGFRALGASSDMPVADALTAILATNKKVYLKLNCSGFLYKNEPIDGYYLVFDDYTNGESTKSISFRDNYIYYDQYDTCVKLRETVITITKASGSATSYDILQETRNIALVSQ